jgi:thiamine pyrophosphokinase
LPTPGQIVFLAGSLEGVFVCRKPQNFFNGQVGDTISLVALTPLVKKITLKNFVYPLQAYNLTFGSSRTMSNELKADAGCVWFEEGILMALHYHRQIGGII